MAGTQNDKMFICARVVGGFGIGFINSLVPVWVSELAKSHNRGFTFAIVFSANYFGIMIANWIMYGVRNWSGGLHWRFPLGVLTAPALFLIATVWFIPESPRWLVGNGKIDLAREILAKVRGDIPLHDPELEHEMAQLIAMAETAKHKRNSLYNIILCGRYSGRLHLGRRAVLSFSALFLMMMTGIMAMSTYSPILFAASGASELKAGWMAGLNQTIGFLGTLAAAPIVDRFGRRRTFYAGLIIQLTVLFLSSAFAKISNDNPGTARGTQFGMAASAMIYLFQWFFCQTTLVVCWVYPTEIWPQEIRAKGNAFGILGWAVGGGSTTLFLPTMFSKLGWKTLMVFACLNVMVLPLVYLFFPETANRSLEEINLLFSLGNPVVSANEKEYKRMLDEAGSEPAVAERRLLDEVDAAYGEKETNPGGTAEKAQDKEEVIYVDFTSKNT